MSHLMRTLTIAFLAFLMPLSLVAYSNRAELRPYFIGDPTTSNGELLYFTQRG